MRRAHLLGAVAAICFATTSANAGKIILTGRFAPGFSEGYVDTNYDYQVGDTSGDVYGDPIFFNIIANYASPKILTFDTPNYGVLTEAFTTFDYIRQNAAGLFYELIGPTGWLDVNIVNPGYGISSFSFTDYATAVTPPPVNPPPCVINCGGEPPPCMTNCGGDPPPVVVGAPEPATWALMAMGFASLGFVGYRRQRTARLATFA